METIPKEYTVPEEARDWMQCIGCAVTICDSAGVILYMNDRARDTYRKHGNLIGASLFDCHGERSTGIIRRLLATGETNTYTVLKHGIRKLIFQSPWRRDGQIAGLVEISIPLPANMAHYDRDAENKL
ncbi:MAG: PAS domain-containing protein [Bacteroidales bacterium]|nr:PAS domain-containing protein [Bacteroidales bacterium]